MSAVLNTAFTAETAAKFQMALPISSSWAPDITLMVIILNILHQGSHD